MRLDWVRFFESKNPLDNLAREETLLEELSPNEAGLVFYVNDPCMVIGKNQNPWWELNPARMEELGIPVLRRISGGGTVFHDNGNLNYSFLVPRTRFSREVNLDLLASFFRKSGLPVEITDKGDLLAGGRKFSGNALCYRKNHVLHHGTLLVTTNLALLEDCLLPSPWRQVISQSAQVHSRPMKTINLSEVMQTGPLEVFATQLAEHCRKESGSCQKSPDSGDQPISAFLVIRERHSEWEWVYGKTPAFSLDLGDGLEHQVLSGRLEPEGFDSTANNKTDSRLPMFFDREELTRRIKCLLP